MSMYCNMVIKNNRTVLIGAIVIFCVAFFLRFYHIDVTPPGIYPDEAVNGQDALKVLDGAPWQWFYTDNQGREGLFMNLVAMSFALFGVSAMSLKLPAIICGSLTVVGTFFLSREIFRSDRIALVAMAFNAVAFTAVNFSRISFRANMLPLVLVWSFYFLYKGMHSRKYLDFVIAGAIFGVGMHTYIAFRIAPLILVFLLPFLMLARKNFLREYWRLLGTFIMSFLIVAAPMFYTFWAHPEYFDSRAEHVFVFSTAVNQGHPIKIFARSFLLSVAKYTFVSDLNWRNNYPPYPLLDPAMGMFFLGGFFCVVYRSGRSIYRRVKYSVWSDDVIIYPFLVFWFFAMLAPEFLTYESNPHALRSIGALPMVYITAALCTGVLYEHMSRAYSGKKFTIRKVLLYGAIVFALLFNPIKYFGFWAHHPLTAIYFEKNITQLAYDIQRVPTDRDVVVILGNMQRVPVRMFNWGRPNYKDFNPFEMDKIVLSDPHNTTFFFSDFHKEEILAKLMTQYPDMRFHEVVNDIGQKYYVLQ